MSNDNAEADDDADSEQPGNQLWHLLGSLCKGKINILSYPEIYHNIARIVTLVP